MRFGRLVGAVALTTLLTGGLAQAASAVSTTRSPDAAAVAATDGPSVIGLAPVAGPVNGGNRVKIHGLNLGTTPPVVHFGSELSPDVFFNHSKLIAEAPPGHGTVDVTVTTADGTSPVTSADRYSYVEITDVSPSSGPAAGGEQITVTGSGFSTAVAVDISNRPEPNRFDYQIVSDTTIILTTPAEPAGTRGSVVVFLSNKFHSPVGPTCNCHYFWT